MSAVVSTVRVVSTGNSRRPHRFTLEANVWADILTILAENEAASTRNAVAKQLGAVYDGTFEDTEEVTINPTSKQSAAVLSTMEQLGIDGFEIEEGEEDEENSNSRSRKKRQPRDCECGCGGTTGGGRFLPGHDSKLKSYLMQRLDQRADLAAGEELVERGWLSAEKLEPRHQKAAAKLEQLENGNHGETSENGNG